MNPPSQTKEIVQLGLARSYPEAKKMAEMRGMKLAPYLLLDKYVAEGKGNSLVAKELLVHPRSHAIFQNGMDINDSITNLSISASEVPKDAFGRAGIGMLVVPKDGEAGLEQSKGKIYVHPESIVVFTGMIQIPVGTWAPSKPHETLGIPIAISPEEFARLTKEQRRWLYRSAGEGVRPIVRGSIDRGEYCDIAVCGEPGYTVEVVGVPMANVHASSGIAPAVHGAEESAAPAEGAQLRFTREGGRLIVEGTPEQLDALEKRMRQ